MDSVDSGVLMVSGVVTVDSPDGVVIDSGVLKLSGVSGVGVSGVGSEGVGSEMVS